MNQKEIHDLKSAARVLELLLRKVKSGYKFDDKVAPKIVTEFEKAVNSVKPAVEELIALKRNKTP